MTVYIQGGLTSFSSGPVSLGGGMVQRETRTGKLPCNYNLRTRRHNLVLTAKSLSITDRDFITRMTFKDSY